MDINVYDFDDHGLLPPRNTEIPEMSPQEKDKDSFVEVGLNDL
jgi:hypothetical protein